MPNTSSAASSIERIFLLILHLYLHDIYVFLQNKYIYTNRSMNFILQHLKGTLKHPL